MIDLRKYSKEQIDEAFDKTTKIFEEIEEVDMGRMQLQLEYARKVIDVYAEGTRNVILAAPTGFGKSLMAFFLAKFFRIIADDSEQTYIMTSNKFLQKQYNRDINTFKFEKFAILSGQGNYTCHVNNLPFTKRKCADVSISSVQSGKSEYGCYTECGYIQARQKAIHAEATILNYNYWLTTMNHVFKANPTSPFAPRALSIFDESHVMGNIVQDMFTIKFNPTSFIRRTFNHMSIVRSRLFDETPTSWLDFENIVYYAEALKRTVDDPAETKHILRQLVAELIDIKNTYNGLTVRLIKRLPIGSNGKPIKNEEDKKLIQFAAYIIETMQQISDMMDIYEELGPETIVVQFEAPDKTKMKPIVELNERGQETILLQCTSEKELIVKAVHEYTEYALFMSATLGNVDDYATQIGLEDDYVGFEIPQVFDFKESPIYKVEPMISMSYRNKTENTPYMLDRIEKILAHHPNERGLIHTGSFQLMKALQEIQNPRIMTYTNSQEKEKLIKLLRSRKDTVICGPSLIEGVDLKNDLCRFMIFMKVPYLSLGDKLVKKKMDIYPNWYNWNTLCSFLQGLGRSIRNKEDWCTTYLLDESFEGFFRRYAPPKWVQDRFKLTKANNIGVEYDPEKEMEDLLKF